MEPKKILQTCIEFGSLRRPLFIPLIFSYGARAQQLDLRAFYEDPTKIANNIFRAWNYFRYDGLINYLDTTLELEALGCKVTWSEDKFKVTEPSRPDNLDYIGVEAKGRVPVAIEVVRRLKGMVRDQAVVAGVLTGPSTLLMEYSRLEGVKQLPQQFVEAATKIGRAYCEAGADLILIIEKEPIDVLLLNDYVRFLSPLKNVVRFYESYLILFLKGGADLRQVSALQDYVDGVVISNIDQLPSKLLKIPLGTTIANKVLIDKICLLNFLKRSSWIKSFSILSTEDEVISLNAENLKLLIDSIKRLS